MGHHPANLGRVALDHDLLDRARAKHTRDGYESIVDRSDVDPITQCDTFRQRIDQLR